MEEVRTLQPLVDKFGAWTFEDLEALELPEWWRYEILDGALVVSPSPGRTHEYASAELRAAIRAGLPESLIVVGPMGVAVEKDSYFVPDLVVTNRDMLDGFGELAPEESRVVIEVESPGSISMDRLAKPAKYAAAGIRHYWRLQTGPLRLTAYRLDGDAYAEAGSWGEGELAHITDPFMLDIDISALLGR